MLRDTSKLDRQALCWEPRPPLTLTLQQLCSTQTACAMVSAAGRSRRAFSMSSSSSAAACRDARSSSPLSGLAVFAFFAAWHTSELFCVPPRCSFPAGTS